jgi:hypothetical protein
MTAFTRRTVITGAAATTAATAVGPVTATLPAHADDAQDLRSFVDLSALLTGVAAGKLAPGTDPIKIKLAYFMRAKTDRAFGRLLQLFRDNQSKPPAMIGDIILNQSGSEVRALARSVMLTWYLGVWYDPRGLQSRESETPDPLLFKFEVVSAAAYTQGWVWRVAQTHPMGYSDWRFGYWAEDPPPLANFIS